MNNAAEGGEAQTGKQSVVISMNAPGYLATLEAHDVELVGFKWAKNDNHDAQRRTGINTAQNFRKTKESKLVLRRAINSIVGDKTNKRLFNVIREIQAAPTVVQRSGQEVAARRTDDVSP